MFEENDFLVDQQTETPDETGQVTETPQPYEIPDDAYVSVKVDGQDKLLPWKEARSGIQFHDVFTRKTQDLATERKRFEAEQQEFGTVKTQYETQIGALRGVLSDPQKLAALYMYAAQNVQGAQPQAPRPLTSDELPKIQQSLREEFNTQVGQYKDELARSYQASKFENELENHMKNVLSQHPLLQAVDGIEDIIYGRVANLGIKTLDEAKEQARVIVEAMSGKASKAYEDQQKRSAVEKANALRNGAEPRGGIPPPANFDRSKITRLDQLDNSWLEWLQNQDRTG